MTVGRFESNPPYTVVFRNVFDSASPSALEFEFSADEHAIVFLDGEILACGPERGSLWHWYKDNVKASVAPGRHTLAVRVSCLGRSLRPYAQMSLQHGLWIQEKSRLLGDSPWQYQIMPWQYAIPARDWGSAPRVIIPATFPSALGWGMADGEEPWRPVRLIADERELYPAELPPMRADEVTDYTYDGRLLTFAHYGCFRCRYTFAGKGTVEMRWHEALECSYGVTDDQPGALWDRFEVDGELKWQDIWYRAGRLIEFRFTGDVKMQEAHFLRIGYPWQFDRMKTRPSDNPTLARLLDNAQRTLECCTWQTYMDCPYYEQLQYISDCRISMLSSYAISSDHRLPRKALQTFPLAMRDDGALACHTPSKDSDSYPFYTASRQVSCLIPGFALYYIQMLHDYAMLREDDELVRRLLPVARRIAAWALSHLQDGILTGMPGWNFLDWVDGWNNGIPTNCADGSGCTLNLIMVQSLRDLADLERVFGSEKRSAADLQEADELAVAVKSCYYDEKRKLFAEDREHTVFSEHAQVWAQLTGITRDAADGLRSGELPECGSCFSFYYLAMARRDGLDDLFSQRMKRYLDLAANPNLDTLPEEFANWRSYCHGWSAHALYFFNNPPFQFGDRL